MKKTARHTIFVLCLALFVVSCSESPRDKIVGEWRGTDSDGQTLSLVLDKDGNVKMIMGNLVAGQTTDRKVTWRLDAGQDPMHLDIVITPFSGESTTFPMIVRFITDSKIQVRLPVDLATRPIEFSDSDKRLQIILTKQ